MKQVILLLLPGFEMLSFSGLRQTFSEAKGIIIIPELKNRNYTNNALSKVLKAVFDWLPRVFKKACGITIKQYKTTPSLFERALLKIA